MDFKKILSEVGSIVVTAASAQVLAAAITRKSPVRSLTPKCTPHTPLEYCMQGRNCFYHKVDRMRLGL